MQTYLAIAPALLPEIACRPQGLVHAAYRIGGGGILLRSALPSSVRGGLLCLSDWAAPPLEQPLLLIEALLRECHQRNYSGILLDFEAPPSPDRLELARRLGDALRPRHWALYLPEVYASSVPWGIPLVCTSISGGDLRTYLQERRSRWGNGRQPALDLERLCMEFRPPGQQGTPLSSQTFQALMDQESPTVFFSAELGVRYFTYLRNGAVRFVLFDDAETLRRKLRLGASLGYSAAFFMYPEVRDLLSSSGPQRP